MKTRHVIDHVGDNLLGFEIFHDSFQLKISYILKPSYKTVNVKIGESLPR
jgi:hypothetical protein